MIIYKVVNIFEPVNYYPWSVNYKIKKHAKAAHIDVTLPNAFSKLRPKLNLMYLLIYDSLKMEIKFLNAFSQP